MCTTTKHLARVTLQRIQKGLGRYEKAKRHDTASRGADYPIIAARTTWSGCEEDSTKRVNEKHEYWLCAAVKEQEK